MRQRHGLGLEILPGAETPLPLGRVRVQQVRHIGAYGGRRESLQADGDDMAFITARIVDADGNLCPRAAHPLTFAIDGPARIVGLCNGDATSLESFKGNSMQAFNGLCVLYLRTLDGSAGHITVTAKADELMHGTVALQGGRGE